MGKHQKNGNPSTGDGRTTKGPKIGMAEFDVKAPSGRSIIGAAIDAWTNRPKKKITGKVTKLPKSK